MKTSMLSITCAALAALAAATAGARSGVNYPVNPLGFAYVKTTNVSLYAHPTAMVVTGRCNHDDPAFTQARAAGAEVLMYLVPIERPDHSFCPQDDEFYMGDPSRVPLWPFPQPGQRVNWPDTHLTDIRAGLAWSDQVVAYVEKVMRENKVDGIFVDVVGARLWSRLADWDSWPREEKDAWTDGNTDLARRLDESRRRINPRFILVTNNLWDRQDRSNIQGEQYIDGVVIEHHPPSGGVLDFASRPYGNLGHRRVLVIAKNTTDALAWARVPGVTHVSDQMLYQYPSIPPVPFHALTDRLDGGASPGTGR